MKKNGAKLLPLGDRVLVRPAEREEVTTGGIVLPDTARKRPHEGKVLAVGSGRLMKNGTRARLSISVGDTIIYSQYSGTEVKVNGEELIILEEDSVLAVKDK